MSRVAALLAAIIGGAAAAFAAVLGGTAMVAGLLWLYVFGDDPWPASATTVLNLAIPLAGFVLWAFFGWAIWNRLKPRAG